VTPAWRIVSPAPPSAVLALAGAGARARRMVLAQSRHVDTAAVYRGDEPLAIAYFGRHGWRRTEMALSIAPAAAGHMKRLIRMTQLTLKAMAETHIIVTRIRRGNAAGQRMAMLVGFRRHGDFEPGVWIYREKRHEFTVREQCGEEGGRGSETATANC